MVAEGSVGGADMVIVITASMIATLIVTALLPARRTREKSKGWDVPVEVEAGESSADVAAVAAVEVNIGVWEDVVVEGSKGSGLVWMEIVEDIVTGMVDTDTVCAVWAWVEAVAGSNRLMSTLAGSVEGCAYSERCALDSGR